MVKRRWYLRDEETALLNMIWDVYVQVYGFLLIINLHFYCGNPHEILVATGGYAFQWNTEVAPCLVQQTDNLELA